MTIIPRRNGVGWGLGPRAMWFRRVSTRRRLEWVSVHTTPEASHAPSPAGGRPDGTPRARRVPNKGRGVSESTRRGGDREENPPVPVSFLSHARGTLQRAWGCAQGPGPFTTFIVLVLKISPSRNCTGLEITPATTQAPPPASLGLGGCRGAARSVTEAG